MAARIGGGEAARTFSTRLRVLGSPHVTQRATARVPGRVASSCRDASTSAGASSRGARATDAEVLRELVNEQEREQALVDKSLQRRRELVKLLRRALGPRAQNGRERERGILAVDLRTDGVFASVKLDAQRARARAERLERRLDYFRADGVGPERHVWPRRRAAARPAAARWWRGARRAATKSSTAACSAQPAWRRAPRARSALIGVAELNDSLEPAAAVVPSRSRTSPARAVGAGDERARLRVTGRSRSWFQSALAASTVSVRARRHALAPQRPLLQHVLTLRVLGRPSCPHRPSRTFFRVLFRLVRQAAALAILWSALSAFTAPCSEFGLVASRARAARKIDRLERFEDPDPGNHAALSNEHALSRLPRGRAQLACGLAPSGLVTSTRHPWARHRILRAWSPAARESAIAEQFASGLCDEAVTRLSDGRADVFLIGTAHISNVSARLVATLMMKSTRRSCGARHGV